MKATEKELKCIDFSLNIRKNLLEQKLKELGSTTILVDKDLTLHEKTELHF